MKSKRSRSLQFSEGLGLRAQRELGCANLSAFFRFCSDVLKTVTSVSITRPNGEGASRLLFPRRGVELRPLVRARWEFTGHNSRQRQSASSNHPA
jgi:hypothetical protein